MHDNCFFPPDAMDPGFIPLPMTLYEHSPPCLGHQELSLFSTPVLGSLVPKF